MARHLYLLRHGKSDWSTDDADHERPLKKRGKQASSLIGQWMQQHGCLPDYIISSTARRALHTAELVCKANNIRTSEIISDNHIYNASPDDLLYILEYCPEQAKRVLLIGHNPGLEELLYYMVNGHVSIPEDGKLLPTATLAVLSMPDSWKKLDSGSAKLELVIRPRDIQQIS